MNGPQNATKAARGAQFAVAIQLLALVRTLAEYFRLKHFAAVVPSLLDAEHYLRGGLITALFVSGAVLAYFVRRYSVTIVLAIANVAALLLYKLVFMQ